MPKKFQTVNTKAEAARARKADKKFEEKARKDKEAEDKLWEDNDKHVLRKQQRKDDKEKKQKDALERKQAAKAMLNQEESEVKGKAAPSSKRTQSEIQVAKEKEAQVRAQLKAKEAAVKANITEEPEILEENPNMKMRELVEKEGIVEARGVEEAIAVLSVEDKLEKHPERRMKAAYAEFEQRELPKLKQEYPNFRLSQLKQMLRKEWMKSPDNPMNKAHASYNSK